MDFQSACCGIGTLNAKLPSAQRSLSPQTVSILLKLCVCARAPHSKDLDLGLGFILAAAGISFVISLVWYIKKPCGVQGSEALGPKCIQKFHNFHLAKHKTRGGGTSRQGRAADPTGCQILIGIAFLGLKRTSYKGVILCAAESNSEANLKFSEKEEVEMCVDEVEPFRGKSGSVSFQGSTHQLAEEGKWASSPSKEGTGSLLWVLAPVALISSIVLPQLLLSTVIDVFIKDEILLEIAASFCSEVSFYIGLAIFLLVADHVQKPYIQFSPKRWGLITGLRGYMTSAFLAMGLKVVASLLAVYITWPALGLPALVAVAPFLAGCLAQLVFEAHLNRRGSSCWPLVPIIFEVYRIYQLTKAAHFIERLMFAMKDVKVTPDVVERGGAMVAMVATFQILGFVCLWSLLTFLIRLFPSRPVAENH